MVWTLKTPLHCGGAVLRRAGKWCPIGVDMGDDSLKLAQLETDRERTTLIAADIEHRPEGVKAGSAGWQRWAMETIRELTAGDKYHGREVVAALPASEIFVEHIKLPQTDIDSLSRANPETISKIKQELPFDCDDMIIRPVPAEQDNVVVIATRVAIGTNQLGTEEVVTRLVLELAACRQHFSTMHRDGEIERLIFLLGPSQSRQICLAIAKQLEMPAQIGDPLGAVKIPGAGGAGIDRRQSQTNWSVAFGLSLS